MPSTTGICRHDDSERATASGARTMPIIRIGSVDARQNASVSNVRGSFSSVPGQVSKASRSAACSAVQHTLVGGESQ